MGFQAYPPREQQPPEAFLFIPCMAAADSYNPPLLDPRHGEHK
jgi:hypothetical protein